MTRSLLSLTAALLFSVAVNAQNTDNFKGTYHMLDSSELYVPRIAGKSFTQTSPPVGTIRAIPEWDPAQAVLVSYPGGFGIPYDLIAEMSQDCKVITIVPSSGQQSTVTTNYNNNGVNMANCLFKIAPLDTYWTRDYGPWFIMVNNSEIAIVDFPYNRPSRTNDDNVPVVMSTYLSEDLYGMDVMHTGGNYMCDGMGVAAMTDLVEDENSLTHAQIDTAFKQYMGITNNYITTDPLGLYIKHIDCWGKFLDVDKILIGKVPVSNSQYSDYEAMATYWAGQTSSYGNHYQVYRTNEPNGEPYSNSLILNKKVFVPIMGGSSTAADNAALAVYQQAMPGYQIFGIIGLSGGDGWVSTDALHCRTHEIADQGMLYIHHHPILDAQTAQTQYFINADIYTLSGSNLITDSVWIKYKINNGSWTKVLMTNTSGHQWQAAIPQQPSGDTVRYFIHAADLSPRGQYHPLIGAADPHKFWITGSVSISENAQKPAIVFPNPAKDYLFIQMQDCSSPNVSIKLLSSIGSEVISLNAPNDCGHMIKLDINDIPQGAYILQIRSGDNLQTKKVLVMH
jgi:agmatine deiminase